MKAFASLGYLALALIPAVALAQQPAACERVQFSEEVLARFPNIRQACLDVITKGDQQYAVVKADLVRASPRRMTIRVKRPDGSHSDPIGVNVAPNERLNVGGQPMAIQDVAVGQELTAYISVKDPGIALAPAEESEVVEFTPVPATPATPPEPAVAAVPAEMPKTATSLPLLGSIGLVLLALGAGFALLRRRSRI
jgi:LPXTG-motif cell wall-anchored protein